MGFSQVADSRGYSAKYFAQASRAEASLARSTAPKFKLSSLAQLGHSSIVVVQEVWLLPAWNLSRLGVRPGSPALAGGSSSLGQQEALMNVVFE